MARTTLTPISTTGAYVSAPDTITWTAADPTNKNQFAMSEGDILLIRNTGAGSHSVTLSSRAYLGRTGDITFSIAAGAYRVYGPLRSTGWQQDDGRFYLEANHAEVEFAVIRPLR